MPGELIVGNFPKYAARKLYDTDLTQVQAIERATMPTGCALSRKEMKSVFETPRVYGFAVDHLGRAIERNVAGFALCAQSKGDVCLLRFAVLPEDRRNRVGELLIREVKFRAILDNAERIVTIVPESCLDAQLFLRRMGFWAVKIDKTCYQGIDQDAIEFEFIVAEGGT
jgi:ribosomal protein S18 acetylase RimI-like enzyme